MIKVLYQELVRKCLLGPVHILESLGTVLNSVGFSFSIPQDGLIRESLHCEKYASTGWIPVTKDASFVASKYYMSIVIGSVSQIMTRYISIDINKASTLWFPKRALNCILLGKDKFPQMYLVFIFNRHIDVFVR